MYRITNPNIDILELAVERLGQLVDKMVFLGGCALGLLLTDVGAPPIRFTQDVDVITEVANLTDYYKLSDQLRKRGFHEDTSEDAPICRWKATDIILDVMPTNPDILGFGNQWYQPALEAAEEMELPSGKRIRMVSAPYFMVSKFAAFDSRGGGDYLMSHDIEDIVAVLDGRPEVVEEVRQIVGELRQHLIERFQTLMDNDDFMDALPGHLPPDSGSQERVPIVIERIEAIAGL